MAIVDELIAVLGYKVEGKDKLKEFQKGLDQTEKKARTTSATVNRETQKQQRTTVVASNKAGIAIGAGVAAVSAAMVAAYKTHAEAERRLTRIGITAGESRAAMTEAGNALNSMAYKFAMPLDGVIGGLETLTASGQDMKQAMEFLPTVVKTAQATGAEVNDIALSALQNASAFKIAANQMGDAFDVMAASGDSGKFELKHFAAFLPKLANAAAMVGYKGIPGLQRVAAYAQTVREKTASEGEAATRLNHVFSKMYAPQTQKAYQKMGVDLPSALAKGLKEGRDIMEVFLDATEKALKGRMENMSKLFALTEMREGVSALLTGRKEGRLKFFLDAASVEKARGTVDKSLSIVMEDQQTKLDRFKLQRERTYNALGAAAADPIGPILDKISSTLENAPAYNAAMDKGMEASGIKGFWNQLLWSSTNDDAARDAMARKGGYVPGENNHRPQADSRKTDAQIALPGVQDANGRRLADIQRQIEQLKLAQERTPGGAAAISAKITSLEGEQAKLRGSTWAAQNSADATKPGAFADITAKIASINEHMAAVSARAMATGATITDSRQDNRQFPVTTTVNVNVAQATDAPRAAGNAVAGAVNQAATPARMNSGPAN